jgi:hypothetical protein
MMSDEEITSALSNLKQHMNIKSNIELEYRPPTTEYEGGSHKIEFKVIPYEGAIYVWSHCGMCDWQVVNFETYEDYVGHTTYETKEDLLTIASLILMSLI